MWANFLIMLKVVAEGERVSIADFNVSSDNVHTPHNVSKALPGDEFCLQLKLVSIFNFRNIMLWGIHFKLFEK